MTWKGRIRRKVCVEHRYVSASKATRLLEEWFVDDKVDSHEDEAVGQEHQRQHHILLAHRLADL